MSRSSEFTSEIPTYVVLLLELDDYRPSRRELEPGLSFSSTGRSRANFLTEARLLAESFVLWPKPLLGKLPGMRDGSRVFLYAGDRLVAGVYLCAANDRGLEGWGQLHYAFIASSHKGQGLYSLIFAETVRRAREWGLRGLVLDSDRQDLPEVYERWGARRVDERPKGRARHVAGLVYRATLGRVAQLVGRFLDRRQATGDALSRRSGG